MRRGRARGTEGPVLTVVSWRDIPAQVIAQNGAETAKVALPGRFEKAIDACAMRSGAEESDAYLAEWRRGVPRPCGPDLAAEAAAAAAALDASYDRARMRALVANGGHDPNLSPSVEKDIDAP